MGVDLTLLPFAHEDEGGQYASSYSLLMLERRRELWEAMRPLQEKPVPARFMSHMARRDDGENTFGDTHQTPYGEPLGYVTAEDLTALSGHPAVLDNPTNRAVWAYLRELPPKTKVALYWH